MRAETRQPSCDERRKTRQPSSRDAGRRTRQLISRRAGWGREKGSLGIVVKMVVYNNSISRRLIVTNN